MSSAADVERTPEGRPPRLAGLPAELAVRGERLVTSISRQPAVEVG